MAVGFCTFEAGGRAYLYDTTTNRLVRSPDAVAVVIDDYLARGARFVREKHGGVLEPEALEHALRFLESARERHGMLQPFFHKEHGEILKAPALEAAIENGLTELVLGVTEQCNLRCRYCIFGGHYRGVRSHRDRHLSWDVASRAIDWFLSRVSAARPPQVSFYGGEPLLKWDTVRRCIERVRASTRGNEALLHVATNLTLLDEPKLAFLVAHRVSLGVSLDGPQAVHDAHRVTADGRGTHATVVGWLARLRDRHPEYFRKHVLLTVTLDRSMDVLEVFDFLAGEDLEGARVQINAVQERDSDRQRLSEAERARHLERLDALTQRYLEASARREPFRRDLFWGLFRGVVTVGAHRCIGLAPAETHPNGTCTPGVRRVFVDAGGDFFPCEKLHARDAVIGHVETGFEVSRVRALLARMVEFCDDACQECWAYRLCSHCLVQFESAGRLMAEQKRLQCENERKRARESLARFAFLWEREPEPVHADPDSLHGLARAFLAEETAT